MIPFWDCVKKTDQCWEWVRGIGSHGYGQYYKERGKPLLAHRLSWEIHKGPIPAGMSVLHRCDNKRCVRPLHLFLGTQGDNMRDMCAKGRHSTIVPTGAEHYNAKITDEIVRVIRNELVIGTRQNPGNAISLAARFGVTRRLIYAVAKRKIWRHVQ